MERFLERLSLSPYHDNLILKGGVLVSAMVGLENRSTMDVDATIINLLLSVESAQKIVEDITSVQLDDGMSFEVKSASIIMDEADYGGVRVLLDATLDRIRTPLKLDFSTGDVITPKEVTFSYKLLFEERSISILAYNLETVLAEKLETLIARGTANTRMRDFYDICIFETMQAENIDPTVLQSAFINTVNADAIEHPVRQK
jgi:predicted nucleotidyltransferase component of viral defense system